MSDNDNSNLPPKHSSNPPHHMTMNGNEPPPQEQPTPGKNALTNNHHVATGHDHSSSTTTTMSTDTGKRRHPNPSKKASNNSNNGQSNHHSVGLSGGSPADNDAAYCTEIARRSVARAALHLGMEGMEGEALDALGSVLLSYLDMVGTTISSNVETSGRSSAHVNAYDALNAIVDCTAPAATQLASEPSIYPNESSSQQLLPSSQQQPDRLKEIQERGWEGIASFLFGPGWFSIPLEGEEEAAAVAAAAASAAASKDAANSLGNNKGGKHILQSNGQMNASAKAPGGKTILPNRPTDSLVPATKQPPKTSGKGKQLSNMPGNEKSVAFTLDRKQISNLGGDSITDGTTAPGDDGGSSNNAISGRWHAPSLNTIPPFPLVSSPERIANPHRLPGSSKISLSMHDLATEMEACREGPSAKRPRRGSGNDQDGSTTVAMKVTRLKDQAADKAMRAELRIPEDVYSTIGTIWGSIQDKDNNSSNNKNESGAKTDGDKKPRTDSKKASGDTGKGAAASSRAKIDTTSSVLNNGTSDHASSASAQMPFYVPNFLPPFPTNQYSDMAQDRLATSMSTSAVMGDVMSRMHNREKRKAAEALTPTATEEKRKTSASERDSVRRSVIGLGKSVGPTYWGSNWLADDEGTGGAQSKPNNNSNTKKILSTVTVAPEDGGSGPSSAVAKKSGSEFQILPLGRASGSRLSKILEGSMNLS